MSIDIACVHGREMSNGLNIDTDGFFHSHLTGMTALTPAVNVPDTCRSVCSPN